MNISYNYINLIALGNFNPAIVTPYFIKSDWGFDFGELTEQSPPYVPVVKSLRFEKIDIIIDLERLELKETKVRDDLKTEVVNIFQSFYQILPYTPLRAVGLNINCKLLFENNEERLSIREKIANPKSYLDFFGAKQVQVNETSLFMEEEKTWIASRFVIEDFNGLKRQIDPTGEEDSFILNYNCEAGDLGESKMARDILLKSLFEGYEKFPEEFLDFIKHLEAK